MVLAGRCKPNDITATEATILNMQLINTILNFYTENKPRRNNSQFLETRIFC